MVRWAGTGLGNKDCEIHGLLANRQMLVTRPLEIVLSKNVANTPHVEVIALIVEALVANRGGKTTSVHPDTPVAISE